jgi:uncharacterized membrane protein YjfL (UPF0719 family)
VRLGLALLPAVLLAGLALVLRAGAAREVRQDGGYVALFVLLGVLWLGVASEALAWIGISVDDDVIERRNVAAAWAVVGALIAVVIGYAFANLGEGDTVGTTLGPAALVLVVCLVLWAVYQRISGALDAIGIERDTSAGLRFAGMAMATSLIVGRAMAGDYVSVEATYRDLWQQGWPALAVVALATFVQRATPVSRGPQRELVWSAGIVPAVAYVGLGVVDVLWLGPWWKAGAP